MLVLNAAAVRQALPMKDAIAGMKQAFAALSSGKAQAPLRGRLDVDAHQGVTLIMPAYIDAGEDAALAVKVVSVFERNPAIGLPLINAAVLVCDPATGRPIAMLEGGALTAIRTGAASGAATDLLARQDAHTLAIFGAGVQARSHLEAVCAVRNIQSVWIYSRTRQRIEALINEYAGREEFPSEMHAASSPAEAAGNAQILCATTTARSPVFADVDVTPGTHINAIGSYKPEVQEVPPETVARARVVVDQREAAWSEAGDLVQPLQAGRITKDHVRAELGEIVLAQQPGRENDEQITFFKSVGNAVQDAEAARLALNRAKEQNLGQTVSW